MSAGARRGATMRFVSSVSIGLLFCVTAATPGNASSPGKTTRSLAKSMKKTGAIPLEGQAGLAVPFECPAVGTKREAKLSIVAATGGTRDWSKRADVRPASFSDSGSVEGPVVFAGYGLVLPNEGYESYSDADVENKIVVVLDGVPRDVAAADRTQMQRYASPRYKALQAAERGAKAILFVAGAEPMTDGETGLVGSGFVALRIGPTIAESLFAGLDQGSLDEIRATLDTGNPHAAGFEFPGLELKLEARLLHESRTAHHVIGRVPAATDSPAAKAGAIVVGARASSADQPSGPGVELLLALGRRLAVKPAAQPIVLAIWSAETGDSSGSATFIADGAIDPRGLLGYVNLQTDVAPADNRLIVESVGSSPVWPRLIERVNVVAGFDVETLEDPWLPADSESYYAAGVPAINLYTGPAVSGQAPLAVGTEEFDRLVVLVDGLVRKLASLEQRPEFVEIARVSDGGADAHDPSRPFTGTVPDYAADVDGLRLDDVIEGGPAEEAGLREGDIITQFGDHTIGDVYDYVDALAAVKIDVPVRVVFTRDGKSMETVVTPRARR